MRDRAPHKRHAASARPRICVIDSKEVGLAYARLDECRFEVMGSLPSLTQLTARAASGYDAILVGCTERLLLSPPFRTRAHQLSRTAHLIALMPSPTPEAGAQAASLGFVGLVSRDVSPRALERTVAATVHGESAFPRNVLNGLVQMVSRLSATRLGAYSDVTLTPRQEQIVELIAGGSTDREIAGVLQISQSTAHKHVQNALRRLNAKTRSQLVASARQPAFRGSLVE
ncbi:MAG: response regulator transcription factor [Chloroflexi bacterium]|nr:MAG: response regulator transcription factor [Chloroflexota bacterium]